MKRKRSTMLISLILSTCASAPMGCSPPAPGTSTDGDANGTGETIRIGFLVKQPEELWFQNEWKYARRCAEDFDFDLLTIDAQNGEKVLSAIDVLGAKGAKGFVICTPDVRLGPAIAAKAQSHNMKVFSVDDQFIGGDGEFMDVPYMGISARAIGEQVGNELYKEYGKRGWLPADTAACGITFEELNTGRERTDGTIDALVKAGFPRERIFLGAEKTTDVPGAFDAANILLTQHPDVKNWLVFSMNDEGVLGALRALEGRGIAAENIAGIGIGAGVGLSEFEKEDATGYFASCMISPLRHGYETTEMLYKWIKDGVEPPAVTYTAGVMAYRHDYKDVMKELGLD
ncbi:MAG: substrate-binding domain-containing protein [Candidatus Hydrogenedentes bacterium]|nr:substrate-binding domain-containing protein [Candidatus Hydrogenedentota bacterium]